MRTVPFFHQHHEALNYLSPARALFWEMGVGKSRVILDTAQRLFRANLIKLLLVVAPNGVHRNWVNREVPIHLDESEYDFLVAWSTSGRAKALIENFLGRCKIEDQLGPHIVALNIEALATEKGFALAQNLLLAFPTLFVIDESSRIKTPRAKCTRAALKLAALAPYRRILSGTPIAQSPLDLYSQFNFLSPSILNMRSLIAFRARYGVWERQRMSGGRGWFEKLVGFQNVEELQQRIAPYTSVLNKEDCLDLPEKIYERREFKLSTQARRAYHSMLTLSAVALGIDGAVVGEDELNARLVELLLDPDTPTATAQNAGVRLLRLQQIAGGHMPANGTSAPFSFDEPNARLQTLLALLEENEGHKVIIWSRFRAEIVEIVARIKHFFPEALVVSYYGATSTADREQAIDLFQNDPRCRFFVGQPHSAGLGLTLTAASLVVYYSNDFSLIARLQSEDRAHRIGQTRAVTYVDLVAQNTVDDRIVEVLQTKKRTAKEFFDADCFRNTAN